MKNWFEITVIALPYFETISQLGIQEKNIYLPQKFCEGIGNI
jgi:hypothetical protein